MSLSGEQLSYPKLKNIGWIFSANAIAVRAGRTARTAPKWRFTGREVGDLTSGLTS